MSGGDQGPWPVELRVNRVEKHLSVAFDNGDRFQLPAEYLRVESPSAEVQGHGPGQKVTIAGRRHVGIMDVEPVGRYAVKIKFDDMHDTGIYPGVICIISARTGSASGRPISPLSTSRG
jgi:DUF971 family protein